MKGRLVRSSNAEKNHAENDRNSSRTKDKMNHFVQCGVILLQYGAGLRRLFCIEDWTK